MERLRTRTSNERLFEVVGAEGNEEVEAGKQAEA